MKKEILYIFDPLCGWCYGFSENIFQFYLRHRNEYDFVPILGGMVTGDRVGPASNMYSYISQAIPRLEETTGCKISKEYMDQILSSDKVISDSEPPSRAVMAVKQLASTKSMDFVKALQHAHYFHAKDYNKDSTYSPLIAALDINEQEFYSLYHSKELQMAVQKEFEWVGNAKIQGFPCVVVNLGGKLTMIANGYTPLEDLETRLAAVIKEQIDTAAPQNQ